MQNQIPECSIQRRHYLTEMQNVAAIEPSRNDRHLIYGALYVLALILLVL